MKNFNILTLISLFLTKGLIWNTSTMPLSNLFTKSDKKKYIHIHISVYIYICFQYSSTIYFSHYSIIYSTYSIGHIHLWLFFFETFLSNVFFLKARLYQYTEFLSQQEHVLQIPFIFYSNFLYIYFLFYALSTLPKKIHRMMIITMKGRKIHQLKRTFQPQWVSFCFLSAAIFHR